MTQTCLANWGRFTVPLAPWPTTYRAARHLNLLAGDKQPLLARILRGWNHESPRHRNLHLIDFSKPEQRPATRFPFFLDQTKFTFFWSWMKVFWIFLGKSDLICQSINPNAVCNTAQNTQSRVKCHMSNVIFHMSLTLAPTVTSRDPPLQRRVPAGEGKNISEPKPSKLKN